MTPEWLLWYGLKVGLGYEAALRQPLGRILDLMAIEQVKHEGAELKDNRRFDPDEMTLEDLIPDLK